jgi:hypothetical protein
MCELKVVHPACTVLLYSILRRLKKANATFCTTSIPTIVLAVVLGVRSDSETPTMELDRD